MTREEETIKASHEYIENDLRGRYEVDFEDIDFAFQSGAEWADNHPKSSWIAVEDKLPEIGQAVFIRTSKSTYGVSYIDYDLDWQGYVAYSPLIVTHWMPIPELPKE